MKDQGSSIIYLISNAELWSVFGYFCIVGSRQHQSQFARTAPVSLAQAFALAAGSGHPNHFLPAN
jgi:hypothetical protein